MLNFGHSISIYPPYVYHPTISKYTFLFNPNFHGQHRFCSGYILYSSVSLMIFTTDPRSSFFLLSLSLLPFRPGGWLDELPNCNFTMLFPVTDVSTEYRLTIHCYGHSQIENKQTAKYPTPNTHFDPGTKYLYNQTIFSNSHQSFAANLTNMTFILLSSCQRNC